MKPFIQIAAILVLGASASQTSRNIEVTLTEGTNMAADVSPDGSQIAIDLLGRIWVMPALGGAAKPITDPLGDARQPAWSPDGQSIVFQAYWDGNWHIWKIDTDGQGLEQLTNGPFDYREPHWSPDGDEILFSSDRDGNYDLWLLDLNTKEMKPLTSSIANEYAPAFSPAGTQIAYLSDEGEQNGVWLWNKKDQTTRRIHSSKAKLYAPSWSPGASQLSFTAIGDGESQLQLLNLQTNALETVSLPEEDVFPFRTSWSSEKNLVYTSTGKIWKLSLKKKNAKENLPFRATVSLERPDYNRKELEFDDESPQPAKGIEAPSLSPDGQTIAFIALGDLWMQENQSAPINLTNSPYLEMTPTWSRDGRYLAYVSDRAGSPDIWVFDLPTKEHRPITTSPGAEANPSFSPDGQTIAFTTSAGPRYGKVWLVDRAGGEPTSLGGFLRSPGKPTWSPDGETLAVTVLAAYSSRFREGVNQILCLDRRGKGNWPLKGLEHWSIGSRTLDGPAWSPDGQWMAFISSGIMWIAPVDKKGQMQGKPLRMTKGLADHPSWAGDSQSILYTSTDQLKRVFLANGREETVDVKINWQRARPVNRKIIQAGYVFDGQSEELRSDVDIVIEQNRIVAIEERDLNRTADQIIDARNAFIMPGLIDMHAHQSSMDGEKLGRTWLSWGVTTTRDPTAAPYDALNRQEAQKAGKLLGPRLFFTGSSIDGSRVYYGGTIAQQNPIQLDQELKRAEKLGYDMVKTYVRLSDPLQKEAVQKAHRIGIPVSSHELYPAVAYGVDGVEHIRGTSRRGYSPKVSETSRTYGDVIQLLAKSGMYFCPTAALSGGFRVLIARNPEFLNDQRFVLFSDPAILRNRAGLISEDSLAWEKTFVHVGNTVRRVVEAGGTVVAGTDSPILPFGASLHLELECYSVGGLNNFEVLKTATSNAAKVLGADRDLGTIEVGKLADLLILDQNPLEDIRNARTIRTVILNGEVHSLSYLMKTK